MKTSEAWTILADTLEACGMPQNYSQDNYCTGLCHCLSVMCADGIISDRQHRLMFRQLVIRFYNGKGFYWPEGKVKPRIKACRILAKESLAEESV
jgi:hypothetical protein